MDRLARCNYCILSLFDSGESPFPGFSASFKKPVAVQYDVSLCFIFVFVFAFALSLSLSCCLVEQWC